MRNKETIEAAKEYLLSRVDGGLCLGFSQLRHGPSMAWTTACIGSTLAEFRIIPQEMLETILSLQWDSGGWSYNQNSAPDADTTLRVMQFLSKVGFGDRVVINEAERFVISHQRVDGGIATYLPEAVTIMGYPADGWTISHPCVTALATRILRNKQARDKARHYIMGCLEKGDARAYWWQTSWYVRYESGITGGESIGNDPVEVALVLLLNARLGKFNNELTTRLIRLQLDDGSFPVSHQFRVPRPNKHLDDITEQVEIIEDRTRIFSTAAAIVAISRQEALLN